jgi:menaquinone-9 beta-reductase
VPSALDADVAVVGAGPAGSATALFAARRGQRVIIVDKQLFPRDKPCGEGLMPSGRPPLRELGLEDMVIREGAPPLEGIAIGLPHRPAAKVAFPPHRGLSSGLGIRRLEFDARLAEMLGRESRIRFCQEVDAKDVRRNDDGLALQTSAGDIRTRSIVVADGLRSPLRHRFGWTVGPRPPHRYGIIAHWRTDAPLDPWVRITFDDGLEVYDGPVPAGQRMVGLLCYQSRMREFGGRLAQRYREVVLALRPELGQAQQVDLPVTVGPFMYRASTVARRGVYLVGDAAGFSDPITGEGIATALRQAAALAIALESSQPERAYRRAHRRITRDPRRVAGLLLHLSRTRALVERGLRSHERAPQMLTKLLGVGFGYWGFNRITPREWVRLLTGR